jgi:hypothetical protein
MSKVSRIIKRNEPKEAIFKTIVQDFYKENPDVDIATVCIYEGKPKRSEAQSNLYFHWKDILASELWGGGGENKKQMHKHLKKEFINNRSTKELNVMEFVDFLCDVEMFANSEGITFQHTDEYKIAVFGIQP